ncbi:importin subunit beta-3 [Ceratobasidium sp. AG-Ba]|nr:importin subunit beta-3 [Ceratobasidium sp. AG-Ba]
MPLKLPLDHMTHSAIAPAPSHPGQKLFDPCSPLHNDHRPLAQMATIESPVTQQIRAELGQILANLVLGDNEIRRSAEKVLNDKWLANHPEILLLALAEFSRQSPDAHMRAFAAVLLRRLVFRPPLHPVPSPHPHQSFAAPKSTIYDHLSEATRNNLELILLAALREERDLNALKGVTETVCELAIGSFERKRPFPELLNTASQLANSGDAIHRESAFRIFTNVPHLLWDQNPQQVVAALENALKTSETISVRHAALRACAVYLSSNDPALQSQTVGLVLPMLMALNEFSPRDQIKALETLTSLASDFRTAALFRSHIGTLTRCMEPFLNEQPPNPTVDASATPTLANPGLPQFVWPPAGTQSSSSKEEEEEALIDRRFAALEFMVSLTEARPGMFRAPIGPEGEGETGGGVIGGENGVQAVWVSTLVRACLKGMGEVIEEDGNATEIAWEECEDPSATDDDYGYPQVFEGTLDRAAVALGGRALLPVAFRDIPIMLSSPEWGVRHAGLMAIAAVAEGTYQVLELEVGKVVELVVPMFADTHPRVRFAACQCIGQLCTDMQEIFQQRYTKEILSCLIPAMDAPEARVHCHAAKALINFCCGVEADELAPYLDEIVPRLLQLLNSPRRYVQEQALTTLAMVADASAEKFRLYYSSIMPLLMQALRTPATPETWALHCKAMECAGLMGIAVGREVFQQDAEELIKVLLQLQEQPTTDDDSTPMHLQQTWAKVCQALGDAFEPYLQFVMPLLLKSAGVKPDINIVEDDDMEAREGFDVLNLDDGQHVEIRTSVLEEKSAAFDALLTHAATLGGKFGPYIRPALELALPGLKKMSEKIIPTLITSGNSTGVISPDEMNAIFLQITRAIQPEGDSGFLASLCKCLADSLLVVGRQAIIAPLANEISAACKAQLAALASRREMRARRVKYGPEWEEDKEDMLLLQELEDSAFDEMGRLLKFLDPNHPRWAFEYRMIPRLEGVPA